MNSSSSNNSNGESFSFSKAQKAYFCFKRLIDLGGSFVGILLLGLPMLVLAIITRCTSKGPALYRQIRLGENEKKFTLLKFRSMRTDAPSIAPNDFAPKEREAMITKWGSFLRKTSLDELPQLFNIFSGQMSFIGPRPQQEKEHEMSLYLARKANNPTGFEVKPGLCSLAIVKMHRSHDPVKKAHYDSEYAKRISFWTDAKIFFTAFAILLGLNKKDRGN